MGNCLKIQLKENVNNDNLIKFGALDFVGTTTSFSESNHIEIRSNTTATLKVLSGGPLVNNNQEALPAEITFSGDLLNVYYPIGTTRISVESKYNITNIRIPYSSIKVDELSYVPITYLYDTKLIGSFNKFINEHPSLSTLLFDTTDQTSMLSEASIDVTDLANRIPNITILGIKGIQFTGNISSMADLQNLNYLSIIECPNVKINRSAYNTLQANNVRVNLIGPQIIEDE